MSAILINGKEVSANLRKTLAEKIKDRKVELVVIQVGKDPASNTYVRNKEKACLEAGIRPVTFRLPDTTTQEELLNLIHRLNKYKATTGILVQLPLPKHIDEKTVVQAIALNKDVDGFHYINQGMLLSGDESIQPCTAKGVMTLLKEYNINVAGKRAVVIGRSNIVGKPIAQMLLNADATVTICHSKTPEADLLEITKSADILVVAVGKPKFVTGDMIKEGAVIIDVGINRDTDGKLCGDVDFDNCVNKASYITPVPGGVGPMTIASLLQNCYELSEKY